MKGSISESTWTTIAKYYKRIGLNKSNLFSHSSGDWKSNIKMSEGLVSVEDSLCVADGHLSYHFILRDTLLWSLFLFE